MPAFGPLAREYNFQHPTSIQALSCSLYCIPFPCISRIFIAFAVSLHLNHWTPTKKGAWQDQSTAKESNPWIALLETASIHYRSR